MEQRGATKGKNTVFVGGISWKADEEGLRKYFEAFGTVLECKIIFDRATNKSKGYGFLTFATPEDAQRVKEAKDLSFLGKTMNVGEAYHKNRTDQMASSPMMGSRVMPGMEMVYPVDYGHGQQPGCRSPRLRPLLAHPLSQENIPPSSLFASSHSLIFDSSSLHLCFANRRRFAPPLTPCTPSIGSAAAVCGTFADHHASLPGLLLRPLRPAPALCAVLELLSRRSHQRRPCL